MTKFYAMDPVKLSTLQLVSVRWWNANAYYAISLSQILQKKNIRVIVGGRSGSPPIQAAIREQLTCCDLDLESFRPWQWSKNLRDLKKVVRQNQINLINAHRPEDHFYSGILRRKLQNIPLIRSVSDVRPPKNNLINKILHLKYTDHFIFSCRANRDRYLQVWPIPLEKTSVIYSGIDTQYFHSQNNKLKNIARYNIPLDSIIFGLVARLSPVKDHISFLKAAALLSAKIPNVFFIISGEEVEIKIEQLRQLSRQLGMYEKILFLDKSNDVRQVIELLDVGIVCSSGSEAVSRITSEFLSMAKPVIVSRINVLPEMITTGHDGFIVGPNSPEDLSIKMYQLAGNSQLLNTMKENARKTAEIRFSYHRFYQDTMAIYDKVINSLTQNMGPQSR